MSGGPRLRVGIDVGGTFTDFALVDAETGQTWLDKLLTTPEDPAKAIIAGLRRLLDGLGSDASQLQSVVHGTTLATNAIVERKGARTALITTRGFRDVLEMARQKRFDVTDINIDLPRPLVPRRLRLEITERIGADGAVLTPLAETEIGQLAKTLADEGIESVAIVLLNAHLNDVHEHRIEEELNRLVPTIATCTSSQVNPEIREYERTSTTVVNAYLKPLIQEYLRSLDGELRSMGYRGQLHIMQSGGGIISERIAGEEPIRIIESGPAACAVAAAALGDLKSVDKVIAYDMGGTTAKVCLIEGGDPTISPEMEVGRLRWDQRGSGFPCRAPSVELIEIGTGGGSVAEVDRAGMLRVGPESTGADPGPACYGRGGTQPTVTDADLLLGYLDPSYFLGGRMALDVAAAEQAMERLGKQLGVTTFEAAWQIHEVANEQMAIATKLYLAERGKDPREYGFIATGGAGPIHAAGIARRLGIGSVIYPPGAGTASAVGFLLAPMSVELSRAWPGSAFDAEHISVLFSSMEAQARSMLTSAGIADSDITYGRFGSLHYEGQGYDIVTEVPAGFPEHAGWDELVEHFHRTYEDLYSRAMPEYKVKALAWRVRATGPKPPSDPWPEVRRHTDDASGSGATRQLHIDRSGAPVTCPVVDRAAMAPGDEIEGPAIVREAESTILILPGMRASVDPNKVLTATFTP